MTALAEASPGIDESGLRPARAGWRLPASLVTKAIASGMFMIMAAIWLLGLSAFDRHVALIGNLAVLVLLAITTVLLVADRERLRHFPRILTRPQWKRWLTRGAVILIGFSLVCTLLFALELGAQLGWLPESVATAARVPLMALGFPLSSLTAIHTPSRFGQFEGRNLWHSRLTPWHMGVQAVLAGVAGWIWAPFSMLDWLIQGGYNYWFPFADIVPRLLIAFGVAFSADLLMRSHEARRRIATNETAEDIRLLGPAALPFWKWSWRAAFGSVLVPGIALVLLPLAIQAALDLFGESTWFNIVRLFWLVPIVAVTLGGWIAFPVLTLLSLYLYYSAIIKSGEDVPNT